MKLSIAMRRGSKLRAASQNGWCDYGPNGELRTCALLAAAEAAGLFMYENGRLVLGPYGVLSQDPKNYRNDNPPGDVTVDSPPEWMSIMEKVELPPCPCAITGVRDFVPVIIWHLHDLHGWTRESIADWIERLEGKHENKTAKTQPLIPEFA